MTQGGLKNADVSNFGYFTGDILRSDNAHSQYFNLSSRECKSIYLRHFELSFQTKLVQCASI